MDLAHHRLTGRYPSAEADRVRHFDDENLVQSSDVAADVHQSLDRLAAGFLGCAVDPEQRHQPVSGELGRASSRLDHTGVHRANETVDDEHRVEWQTCFREPG